MDTVYLIANVFGKRDKSALVKMALEELAAHTRNEEGNVFFIMHTIKDDPSTFVFYEAYKNEELFQQHLNSAHVKKFVDEAEKNDMFRQEVEIIRLTKLSE